MMAAANLACMDADHYTTWVHGIEVDIRRDEIQRSLWTATTRFHGRAKLAEGASLPAIQAMLTRWSASTLALRLGVNP